MGYITIFLWSLIGECSARKSAAVLWSSCCSTNFSAAEDYSWRNFLRQSLYLLVKDWLPWLNKSFCPSMAEVDWKNFHYFSFAGTAIARLLSSVDLTCLVRSWNITRKVSAQYSSYHPWLNLSYYPYPVSSLHYFCRFPWQHYFQPLYSVLHLL